MAHTSRSEPYAYLPLHLGKLFEDPGLQAFHRGHNADLTVNTSEAQIFAPKIKPVEVAIRALSGDGQVTQAVLCAMGSAIVAPLWEEEELLPTRALALYLEVIAYFYGHKALTSNAIQAELSARGMGLRVIEYQITGAGALDAINELIDECPLEKTTGLEGIESDRDLLESIMFTVLLLMGKNLIENSCQIWVQRRVQNFMATLGRDTAPSLPSMQLQAVRAIYSRISSMHTLRSICFRIIQKSSSRKDRTAPLATVALGLLSYTEMGHIAVIFEYIISNYAEILTSRHLQGSNTAGFSKVLDFMNTVDPADRPFIKLLYSPQRTKMMHRDRFPLIIDAAYAVAAFVKPSFKNYRGSSHDTSKGIEQHVTQYLRALSEKQATLMLSASYAGIDDNLKMSVGKAIGFFELNTNQTIEEQTTERN